MIVDTSGLIAIIKDEGDAERCRELLLQATTLSMSAANVFEAYIVVDRSGRIDAPHHLKDLLRDYVIQVAPVTESQIAVARLAYARYGRDRHPARLNFGDCFAYALAKETGEPLLFVGNDFSQTDIGVA